MVTGALCADARRAVVLSVSPSILVAGDLNGDRFADLALVERHDNRADIRVLLGGRDTFHVLPSIPLAEIADRQFKPRLVIIDVDGDGKMDLVATNGVRRAVSFYLGMAAEDFILVQK